MAREKFRPHPSRLANEIAANMPAAAILGNRPTPLPPDKRPRFKTFTPLDDQIALHALPVTRKVGELQLPETAKHPYDSPLGLVIAVGPNVKFVKEGDIMVVTADTQGVLMCHGGSGPVMLVSEAMMLSGVALPPEEIEKNRLAAEKLPPETWSLRED